MKKKTNSQNVKSHLIILAQYNKIEKGNGECVKATTTRP